MRPGQLGLIAVLAGLAVAPGGAAAAPGEPSSYRGDCKLVVDGTTYFDIKKTCPVYEFNDEWGTVIVNSDGEAALGAYFAYINPNGDGTATVSWNEQKGAPNARATLGEDFTLKDGCWSNGRATLCAGR